MLIIIALFIVVQFYWFDGAKIMKRLSTAYASSLQLMDDFPKLPGRFPDSWKRRPLPDVKVYICTNSPALYKFNAFANCRIRFFTTFAQ